MISQAIQVARVSCTKVICFVTGVPGAGKTLVGLNIATEHMDKASELYSVFLSGNGPLVRVPREALPRGTEYAGSVNRAASSEGNGHQ